MDKIDLILKTGRITNQNLSTYASNGYIPIFICRFMNPMVKMYEGTQLHFPEFSPSPKLLWDIKNGRITWDEYKIRYTDEMRNINLVDSMSRIYNLVKRNPEVNARGAVLLCYCRDYLNCHRSLLASMINESNLLMESVNELYV